MSMEKPFDLTGRTALVTGGSRGIGRAIALAMAESGADVAIAYRAAAKEAQEVVDAIAALGRRAWQFQQDLAETEKLAGLADRAWEAAGQIDILVNNAGMAYLQMFNEIDYDHWRRVMAINLDAPFFLAQRLAEHMIAGGSGGGSSTWVRRTASWPRRTWPTTTPPRAGSSCSPAPWPSSWERTALPATTSIPEMWSPRYWKRRRSTGRSGTT